MKRTQWVWAAIPLLVALSICGCQSSNEPTDSGGVGNEGQSTEAASTSESYDPLPQFSYESDSELNEKTKKRFEQYLDQVSGEKTLYQLAGSGGRTIEIDDVMDSAIIYSSDGLDQMLDYSRKTSPTMTFGAISTN